jgi:hypothetical protein
MSRFTSRFLVAIAAASLVGIVNMPSVFADSSAGVCNGTVVTGATLKVDGVSVPVNASGSTYALTVCRIPDSGYYWIQVGLYDFGVLKEELTPANLEKTFEVTFRPTSGDTLTVADFYGRLQTYVIGSDVVVSVKPTALSIVDDPSGACRRIEFSDATCVSRTTSRDMSAMVLGTVRFDTTSSISKYSKLSGATVSASANMYDIDLSGPCPMSSSTFTGNEGEASRPLTGDASLDSTTLTVKMVGPHFKLDGSTLNTGSLEVFIPKETITACFGGTATDLATSLGITRTEAGVTADVVKTSGAPTTGLQYATSVIGDALKISITAVSFSNPSYKLQLHKATVAVDLIQSPVVVNKNQLSLKANKTAKELATQAKLAMPSGSKVSLKVVSSTAKYCKVIGTTIKGLKVGTCKVTVTVKPKKGASKSRTLTLKVA